MAVLTPYPKFRVYHPTTGVPLEGGKVYCFETGTATEKDTYTDSTEATPNAHPVILDSAGEADIWFATDEQYRVRVDDSDDNVVMGPVDVVGALVLAASTTASGIVELATNAEVVTGASATLVVTCASLQNKTASATAKGIVELATPAEVVTGTSTALAVTPAGITSQAIDIRSYAADAEATDTYVIALAPIPAAYYDGMTVTFLANTTNTGAASLNVNALGADAIKKQHDQDLEDGDIEASQIVMVKHDGTNWQMMNPPAFITPSFFARKEAAQDNIATGSDITLVVGTERFDVGSNFAANTFTASRDGKYQLNGSAIFQSMDVDADTVAIKIITSNFTYSIATVDPGVFASDPTRWPMGGGHTVDMDKADTAIFAVNITGGAAQMDVDTAYFSGHLVGP